MTATATNVSKPRFLVALQGFSEFERSALASYFRLAGERFPAYEQTDAMSDARFIVADADHPGVVQAVAESDRVGDTVYIGSQAPDGALAWMMRPIDPMHVLRELDAAVAMRHGRAAAPGPAAGAPSRRASDRPEPDRQTPDVLVVDDHELSARSLERQLQSLGLGVVRANTSAKALELMSRLAFRFVFLDVELGPASELDGLALCQHIKQQHHQAGGPMPAVFVMSARGQEVDRVRATLARCDAFFDKPVDDAGLRRLLSAHGARLVRGGGGLQALQR